MTATACRATDSSRSTVCSTISSCPNIATHVMSNPKSYDAIIIGGGPAGSTAASVLAGKGRKVVVLERERFPRYHIGESLIPFTYFTLERIGMIERMKASHFTKKYSVAFVSQDGRASQPFYFFKHWEHDAAR